MDDLGKKLDPRMARKLVSGHSGPPLDFTNAEILKCKNALCNSDIFEYAVRLRRISPIMSPTGEEVIGVEQVLICKKCGEEMKLGN